MKFEDYIDQQMNAQEGPSSPSQSVSGLPAEDSVTATMDARHLSEIKSEISRITTTTTDWTPSHLMKELARDLFDENSPEARAIDAKIEQETGGRELLLTTLNKEATILSRHASVIENAVKEAIHKVKEAQWELSQYYDSMGTADQSLIDVLNFRNAPPDEVLPAMETLYQRYRRKPAAMGLLYGTATEIKPDFDNFVSRAEYDILLDQILRAAQGDPDN